MKKILFITEYLNPPYDEGIKKTIFQLFENLDKRYDLQVICRYGPQGVENISCLNTNKLFISRTLKNKISDFKPDTIIYFPFASSTFAGYIRHFIISKYFSSAKNILIALQPKGLKGWQNLLVKIIRPKIVLTPSPLLHERLDKMHIQNQLIPLYTDLSKFRPIESSNEKQKLRSKYNIATECFVISHMGHLNEGRNLKSLIALQKDNCQVVIVSSSSTPLDALGPSQLKNELEESGIIILDRYIENIEEIYQLSDLYVFPVFAPNSSIGLPLSILEARACGIPVLSNDYGSIKHFLGDDNGSIIYSEPQEFLNGLGYFLKNPRSNYQETLVKSLNGEFLNAIIKNIES